jgi:hypothetical protein
MGTGPLPRSVLLIVVLLIALVASSPFGSEPASTAVRAATVSSFDHLRISAIYDDTRNREYLYVFDSRTGDIWKYNMDEPGEEPRHIGRMSEPGAALQTDR